MIKPNLTDYIISDPDPENPTLPFGEIFEYKVFEWSGSVNIPNGVSLVSVTSHIDGIFDIKITIDESIEDDGSLIVPFTIIGQFKDVFDQRRIQFKTFQYLETSITHQDHHVTRFGDVPYRPKDDPLSVELYRYIPDRQITKDIIFWFDYIYMYADEEIIEPIEKSGSSTSFITVFQDFSVGRNALIDKLKFN